MPVGEEAAAPVVIRDGADLLRRAAEALRDPYRCNSDPQVDRCLAALLDEVARHVDARFEAAAMVGIDPEEIKQDDERRAEDVARAVLRIDEHG